MKRYNMNISCKGLYNRMTRNEINFDCAVQRGLVWDIAKKRLLIHSILYGYTIPAFYLAKNDDGSFDSLDGKQRSNTIYSFLNGEFNLGEDFPVVFDDEGNENNFSGYFFETLPEWAQDRIKDFSLTVYYYEGVTEEEVREFFRRINNGKPLSAVELTRVQAKSITRFQQIAKHTAIQMITTEKGKSRFSDENIAMQCYAMCYMPDPDFGTKVFRPWIIDAIVNDDQMDTINLALDKVANLLDILAEEPKENKENARVLRRLKSRTHFVSAVYLAALAKNMDETDYQAMVYNFFNSSATSQNPDYNESVGAGSAASYAVQTRQRVLRELVEKNS